MKRISTILLALVLFVGGIPCMTADSQSYGATKEVRGMWISYKDFEDLGLKNNSEKTFRTKISKLLKEGKKYGINRVYFHVRAFDDAAWKSKTFAASKYLTSKASSRKTASKTYSYDPLSVVIAESKKQGIKVEAWLNPYRITLYTFLNPKSSYSTDRINRAVTELKAYNLAGIHFDDYFYHAKSRYVSPNKKSRYGISVSGSYTSKKPSAYYQRSYCNTMIKSVYKNVHKKKGLTFGVAPQGNVDNCMGAGADVKTWLSKSGYVDYVAPQIYWTDQWGSRGKVKMYTNRLNQWKDLNKNKKQILTGLALYRAGTSTAGDPGWKKSSKNLANQVIKARKAKYNGFVLFRAADLYRNGAKKELENLKKVLK